MAEAGQMTPGHSADAPAEGLAVPAGAVSRLIAFSIDLTLTSILVGGTIVVLNALGIVFSALDTAAALLGSLAATVIAFIVYCSIAWTIFGQTLGKLLFGLRVVRPDGKNPHLLRSLIRALGYFLSAILFIGFAMVLVTKNRRALHDYLAGTYVVYAWPARPGSAVRLPTMAPLIPATQNRKG